MGSACSCCASMPARLVIGIQCFLATCCGLAVRIALSVLLLAMVIPADLGDAAPAEDYGPQYDWSHTVQGHLLAAYDYGSVLTSLVGGVLSEWAGPRIVVGVTSLGAALLTVLCPLAAQLGYGWLIGLRVLTGFLAGALFPALHNLMAQWAPPQEKDRFILCLLGGTFGSAVTWPISAVLTQFCGWMVAFYVLGGLVAVWSLVWLFTVYDSPMQHPRISDDELDYIVDSIKGTVSNPRRTLPLWSVLSSGPYITLVILHFGSLGDLFFQLTECPKYIMEVQGFNLLNSGGYASIPHLFRLIFGILFCSLSEWCVFETSVSKTVIRKLFVIPSHIIPGLLMVGMGYVGQNDVLAISILSMSLGFNGAATFTNLTIHHDLAPNHPGSLYGIMNAIGTTTGFIFPLLVGYMLEESNTVEQWETIFFIVAGMYLVCGLIFLLFGTEEEQPWDNEGDFTY